MGRSSPNIKSFYRGQEIFKEGQESSVAYMIKKGAVNIYKVQNNEKIILARLSEGEIFGEMGIISKGNRSANAEAAEYCDLVILTEQIIFKLLDQCPRTIQYMTRLLVKRLARTGEMISAKGHRSHFTSICHILDLTHQTHVSMPRDKARKERNHDLGVEYSKLCKTIRNIILVSQSDIDAVINRLKCLKIIEVTDLRTGKAFSDRFIQISDPDNFLEITANLFKELQQTAYTTTSELQVVDIYEISDMLESDPRIIYKKIANEDFPENMFMFDRKMVSEWAAEKEPDYFSKVRKKKKSLEELEYIEDIVFVDNATLKQAFTRLGYHKLSILMSVAEDEARKKIISNLARKIAKIVQDEIRDQVDESEAEDAVNELFEMVRRLKGGDNG
ncbi:cyclic nucleotide-binding domain-containing protein [Maridesulfovibrio hydrothermalis]|uniref:Putative transcriptional regulator, Crp/Fnr family n=1 Tax=Maridesulfovibrio hydrothermalis AM13 = DSM 14728 TaxID=1121451 RepID=L0R9Y5_9BACT|nr:cyclic nucleotide-binding domain-containing protein [Maridesulfovibrio hydrothermalis]CCO22990.1 putative transcriptional regulator, Crp/Fnr family [Maridesulfovibrio hydrothermalis AM13 = DSM 14728]